jgi:hypothetical protein
MDKLSGNVTFGLDADLWQLWNWRLPVDFAPESYTWQEIIASVQETARAAAALDGLTPAQVIERQIAAVRNGLVNGKNWGPDKHEFDEVRAPFCGCLISWAGHAVGHEVTTGHCDSDPLFQEVRDGQEYAPIEILAFLLMPGEQDEPQSDLVIRALEQAKAEL